MSSARLRPTRAETRRRLFTAAASVFAEYGVGAASIEQIADAAGFTRGAFYSNFASKEELVLAMLDDHLDRSEAHNLDLHDRHPHAGGLVQALRDDEGRRDDPLHRNPLLQVELMLYAARTPELRPALGEHLRTMRGLVGTIAADTMRADGVDPSIDPIELGTILVAIEDGLRLHRLIDPESTPADAFFTALESLQQLVDPTRAPVAADASTSPSKLAGDSA
jgi:AcrR family transcriptional regulator